MRRLRASRGASSAVFPRFLRRGPARRQFRPTLLAQIDYAFLVPALRFLPPLD
ncbi:Hypothetical protein BN69_0576 [Methylocystis sp. SC2]|nr:Hypothetical protein BN69_0576 [Methylocystis sp. SC2]